MATNSLIGLEEYLRTSFEGPEPDYIEGELLQRSVPNVSHARAQIRLADAFKQCEDLTQVSRMSEIRVRVAPNRFRTADFAVFSKEQEEPIPEETPFCVVEIVSPDDGYEDLMNKLADYEAAGVEFIFFADPPLKKLSRYRQGDLLTVRALELPAYQVVIPLTEIFGQQT